MTDKPKITAKIDYDAHTLSFQTDGSYLVEVINFKEEAVRRSLINLGWTPPTDYTLTETPPFHPMSEAEKAALGQSEVQE